MGVGISKDGDGEREGGHRLIVKVVRCSSREPREWPEGRPGKPWRGERARRDHLLIVFKFPGPRGLSSGSSLGALGLHYRVT